MRLSDEGLNIVSDTSPKLKDIGRGEQQRIITEEDLLSMDANKIKVEKSPAIRKISLPVSGLSFRNNTVTKKRIRGDIRTMIA